MGKRTHGRLVHEVREALFRSGFMPTRVTCLGAPDRPHEVRSSGFKVEKHNDGKSVRVSHVTVPAAVGAADAPAKVFLSQARPRRQAEYAAALEREGFARVPAAAGEGSGPFSLWRRCDVSVWGLPEGTGR